MNQKFKYLKQNFLNSWTVVWTQKQNAKKYTRQNEKIESVSRPVSIVLWNNNSEMTWGNI